MDIFYSLLDIIWGDMLSSILEGGNL